VATVARRVVRGIFTGVTWRRRLCAVRRRVAGRRREMSRRSFSRESDMFRSSAPDGQCRLPAGLRTSGLAALAGRWRFRLFAIATGRRASCSCRLSFLQQSLLLCAAVIVVRLSELALVSIALAAADVEVSSSLFAGNAVRVRRPSMSCAAGLAETALTTYSIPAAPEMGPRLFLVLL